MRYRNFLALFLLLHCPSLSAQVTTYVGVLGGISTLSADAGSQKTAQGLSLSSYAPANGGVIDVVVGAHLHNYISVQANYIWNSNDLVFNSSLSNGVFYQEARNTTQNAGIVDLLVYFRRRSSRIRPYLGTGAGVSHLTSDLSHVIASGGTLTLPPPTFSSTGPVFRSHVGIDLRIKHKLDFRYSFSETIGPNKLSHELTPPAPRRLANFQNLFGFVYRF